jgi:prophage tail gpP-like protein
LALKPLDAASLLTVAGALDLVLVPFAETGRPRVPAAGAPLKARMGCPPVLQGYGKEPAA